MRERERSGLGQRVEVSLLGSVLTALVNLSQSYVGAGVVPARVGSGHPSIVPYQTFDCADGLALCLAPGNDRLWARCATVLGHPDWATDPKYAKSAARVAHKTELLPMIAAAMKTKTRAEWVEALETAGVPCAAVNDIGELVNTPQFEASEIVQQLPGGDPKVVGLPITFDRKRTFTSSSEPKNPTNA